MTNNKSTDSNNNNQRLKNVCIIIENKTGNPIREDIAKRCVELNPDGFGIVYLKGDGNFRTLDMEAGLRLLLTEKRPYVAHCRYATVGQVCGDSCHPFPLGKGRYLFQNGTINVADNSKCDTLQLADVLHGMPMDKISFILESLSPTRFSVVKTKGNPRTYRFGKWHKDSGVWFSKQNVLKEDPKAYAGGSTVYDSQYWEDYGDAWDSYYRDGGRERVVIDEPNEAIDETHVVAVYGTLCYGRGNHKVMKEAGGEFIGYGQTSNKMRLFVEGLPFLITGKSDQGHNVEVEVYKVDDKGLARIDSLEGHPDFYCRDLVNIDMERGGRISAYVYTVGEEYIPPGANFVNRF